MKVKSKMAYPVRERDGSWTTVVKHFEEEIPDLGRAELICNKCGMKNYPECKKVCKAWEQHKSSKS